MKKPTVILGAHMSIAGGLDKAIDRAIATRATTMQIFTKNNKSWFGKNISTEESELFKKKLKESNLVKIMAHTSYLINIGSAKKDVEKKSIEALKHEIERCEQLNIPYLVLHPGSHIGQGEEKAIKQISKNLDKVLEKVSGKTKILLETMAGQGTSIGHTFEQIKEIIQGCTHKKKIEVCLDTCHIFSAGYNIATPKGYENTLNHFKKTIGIRKLKAIHLNDSKTKFNSRKDRHENIGKGEIPLKTFELIMNDKQLQNIPKVLETPSQDGIIEYKKEIKLLRNMIRKS